jgi:hypothetical protein
MSVLDSFVPETPVAPRGLLAMQRAAGNQAVSRMVARAIASGGAPTIQRAGGASTVTRDAVDAVKKAPDVPESAVPGPDTVQDALNAGNSVGAELDVAKGNPDIAQEFQEELAAEPDEDGGPKPQTEIEQLAAYQASLGGSAPAAPAAHQSNASTNHGNKAKTATTIGTSVSKIGASASQAGVTMASAGASIAAALGYVAAGLGAIVGIFDIKSAISSGRKGSQLEAVMAELKKANPADSELIDAIQYAIEQKYSKSKTRALRATTGILGSGIAIGALAAGVSLVALASNPVGWVIAAVLAGTATAIGIGIIAYKLGRKLWKWYHGDLGLKRRKIAMRLYDKCVGGDGHAAAALKSIGMDPAKIRARAAEGETPAQEKARKGGSGYKDVMAQQARRLKKTQESSGLVAGTQAKIAALQAKIADAQMRAARASGGAALSYLHMAGKYEAEIKKLNGRLIEQRGKLAERQRKLKQDDVAIAWKSHTKSARNDVKLIERKLKK